MVFFSDSDAPANNASVIMRTEPVIIPKIMDITGKWQINCVIMDMKIP